MLPRSAAEPIIDDLIEDYEHGLRPSDLTEVGSQGVVSEILTGKRELKLRQVRALAARFSVSPAPFV